LGVPVNAVLLSAAIEQTVGLGLNFGVIELRK
jgi:hypothetical protein